MLTFRAVRVISLIVVAPDKFTKRL